MDEKQPCVRAHAEFLRLFLAAEQDEHRLDFEERRQRLQHCLERFSGAQAALVGGYYWDRLEVDALAQRTRSSAEAVYKRLQRIRALPLDCVRHLEKREVPA